MYLDLAQSDHDNAQVAWLRGNQMGFIKLVIVAHLPTPLINHGTPPYNSLATMAHLPTLP